MTVVEGVGYEVSRVVVSCIVCGHIVNFQVCVLGATLLAPVSFLHFTLVGDACIPSPRSVIH